MHASIIPGSPTRSSCAGNLGRMKPGQLAPDFSLPDQDGTPHSLTSLLANGPLVLFFYPAASTPVCTAEACPFRDLGSEFAAAVADWRMASASDRKLKKSKDGLPVLSFAENPDILKTVSAAGARRPKLVVGFAAETNDVVENATAKRLRKGCDWIVANDVSPATGIMGGAENAVTLITDAGAESWPRMGKDQVAQQLAARIAETLS